MFKNLTALFLSCFFIISSVYGSEIPEMEESSHRPIPSLLTLPSELIEKIIGSAEIDSKKTLRSTNKKLCSFIDEALNFKIKVESIDVLENKLGIIKSATIEHWIAGCLKDPQGEGREKTSKLKNLISLKKLLLIAYTPYTSFNGHDEEHHPNYNETLTVMREGIAALLSSSRSLIKIDFHDCLLGDEGVKVIASGLAQCSQLEILNLSYNALTPLGFKALQNTFNTLSHLKELHLKRSDFDAESMRCIASIKSLNILVLSDSLFAASENLQVLTSLSALTFLSLARCEIETGTVFKKPIKIEDITFIKKLTDLQMLDIKNNAVKAEDIADLSYLTRIKTLTL